MEIRNAIITKATLGTEDRGFLDAWLHLDYGGLCQGFGGYVLHLPKGFDRHSLESIAGNHICRVLEVAGVTMWDRLVGKTIRVRIEDGTIRAIGHIVKDDWYCPRDEYATLNAKEGK